MAGRIASAVSDDDDFDVMDTLPEVNHVGHLSITASKTENSDPFNKDAEDIKKYAGTDAVFKRRVSNELKKVYRGDGAASKQIQEKPLTGYNIYDVVEPSYNLDYLAKLYEASAPHYSAVNAKVANIVGLGYKFVETSKTKRALEKMDGSEEKLKRARTKLEIHRDELLEALDRFNEEDTFTETLTKVWRDYEVTGNGYIEIGRKKDGSIGYVGHIPAQTIRIRQQRDGFVQMSGFKVQFFANFGAGVDKNTGKPKSIPNPLGGGVPNEVIHLKRYSPTSGFYGVPDIIAAKNAVAGNEFAARFNLDYFENKAIPRHLIILKGAKLGTRAEANLLQFFETNLKGQNHRTLYIPLPGDTDDNKVDLKIEPIEAGVQDSSFNNYRKANLSDILMAHRVPITKISVAEGASLAVARDADKTFKEQVCAPEQRVLEKKLNRMVRELTDAFEIKMNEMTLTDADTQSKIDERYVKTGVILPNEIRADQGRQGIKGGNERVDLNAKDKIQQQQAEVRAQGNRQRDSARSAGATDSAGEARNPQGEGRSTG
jgi:PBSX family phage portal protein